MPNITYVRMGFVHDNTSTKSWNFMRFLYSYGMYGEVERAGNMTKDKVYNRQLSDVM
jgi:hypothetical protein